MERKEEEEEENNSTNMRQPRTIILPESDPAVSNRGMRIWGQTLFLNPVHDRHHRDLARYSAIWCTSGYDVNKNKTRTFVPVMLEVSSAVSVQEWKTTLSTPLSQVFTRN